MGDGVLSYFGWPTAHEDDAQRAVQAGLELTHVVGGLRSDNGARLAARVGIATGLVVVGELIGSGEVQERSVVGETPTSPPAFKRWPSRTMWSSVCAHSARPVVCL